MYLRETVLSSSGWAKAEFVLAGRALVSVELLPMGAKLSSQVSYGSPIKPGAGLSSGIMSPLTDRDRADNSFWETWGLAQAFPGKASFGCVTLNDYRHSSAASWPILTASAQWAAASAFRNNLLPQRRRSEKCLDIVSIPL